MKVIELVVEDYVTEDGKGRITFRGGVVWRNPAADVLSVRPAATEEVSSPDWFKEGERVINVASDLAGIVMRNGSVTFSDNTTLSPAAAAQAANDKTLVWAS